MFDPRVIFSGLWLLQVIGHLSLGGQFYPLSWQTWIIVISAISAFLIGAKVGLWMPTPFCLLGSVKDVRGAPIRSFAVIAITIYLVGCLAGSVALYRLLDGNSTIVEYIIVNGGGVSFAAIRAAVNQDFIGDREIFNILRIFYFGVGLCVFLLAYAKSFTSSEVAAILVIGLISALATTGRLYVLLFVVAGVALLYRQRLISAKAVAGAGVGFVALFIGAALLYAKGAQAGSVVRQIIWNLEIYTLSGLACFNNYVNTGIPTIEGGALLPNAARTILGQLGIAIAAKPPLMPQASVPSECNTYTALFPLYHDGGQLGVIIGLFALGILHQYLYKIHLRSESPVIWYVFALSLYPLILSIFEDAYFSSPGFWLLLWIPPFVFWISRQVHRNVYGDNDRR